MNKRSFFLIMIAVFMVNAVQAEEKVCTPLEHYVRAGACLLTSSLIWGIRSGEISTPLFAKVASKGPLSWFVASAITTPLGIYGIMQISLGNTKYNAAELRKMEAAKGSCQIISKEKLYRALSGTLDK